MSACGENAEQREARQTVDRFYSALRAHDAKTACGLVSSAVARVMLRDTGEGGKPCVAGLEDLFRRPGFVESRPKVAGATVAGDRATVVITRGYQRRKLILRRANGAWRITGAPDFRR